MVATSNASVTGFRLPAANGAIERGMSATDRARSNVQWYEPCVGEGFGIGAGSLMVPSITCGPAGRMCFGLLVWNVAASGRCERVEEVGRSASSRKPLASDALVEYARLAVAANAVRRSNTDRIADAISVGLRKGRCRVDLNSVKDGG
jgi:hypothetical protein